MLERSTIGMFTLSLHVNVSQAFTIIHGYLLLCILPAMGSVPFSLAYLADASEADKIDIETLLESLEKKVDRNSTTPNCITSKV